MPVEQLSGVTVVIIIAVCVEAFIVLLIFARRQIMRFGLRNRRGPHTHIGLGGPKPLRREVDRKLDYIPYVKYEPPPSSSPDSNQPLVYRVKALEDYRAFEADLFRHYPSFARIAGSNIRSFLNSCLSGPLARVNPRLIHQICDDYSDARFHYGDFDRERYEKYALRLETLRKEVIRQNPATLKRDKPNISNNRLSLEMQESGSTTTNSLPLQTLGGGGGSSSSTVLVVGTDSCSSSTAV